MSNDLDQALEHLRARRDSLREELARLEGVREDLERVEAALAALEGSEPLDPDAAAWLRLDRTEAIRRILGSADGPVPRPDLVRRLQEHGRDDTAEAVSASLSYMKRQGEVDNPTEGHWTLLRG